VGGNTGFSQRTTYDMCLSGSMFFQARLVFAVSDVLYSAIISLLGGIHSACAFRIAFVQFLRSQTFLQTLPYLFSSYHYLSLLCKLYSRTQTYRTGEMPDCERRGVLHQNLFLWADGGRPARYTLPFNQCASEQRIATIYPLIACASATDSTRVGRYE
jgi:hypothetical protein